MLLIISLIIVSLFIYFLKGSLKKHAGIYYCQYGSSGSAFEPDAEFRSCKKGCKIESD